MKKFEVRLTLSEGALIKQLLTEHIEEMIQYIEDCSLDAEEESEDISHIFANVPDVQKAAVDAPYGYKKDGTPKKAPGRKAAKTKKG